MQPREREPFDNHSVQPRDNHSMQPLDNHSVQPHDNQSGQSCENLLWNLMITFRAPVNVTKITSEFLEVYHTSILTAG